MANIKNSLSSSWETYPTLGSLLDSELDMQGNVSKGPRDQFPAVAECGRGLTHVRDSIKLGKQTRSCEVR